MNTAERIARLEALLARVMERKNAPRPVRVPVTAAQASAPPAVEAAAARPLAVPPERETLPAPPAVAPAPVAPVPPPTEVVPPSPESWGVAPTPAPEPVRTPIPPAPAVEAEPLPDLELVETATETGDRRPSLVPSVPPPSAAAEQAEFEIPAHAPPSGIVPPVEALPAIELESQPAAQELEIDRAPLASAVPPRPETAPVEPVSHGRDVVAGAASIAASAAAGLAVGVAAGVAAAAAAVSTITGAAEARAPAREPLAPPPSEALEIEPAVPPPPATPTAARPAEAVAVGERFEGRALPSEEVARVVPLAGPPAPASFRALLERSLALRVR